LLCWASLSGAAEIGPGAVSLQRLAAVNAQAQLRVHPARSSLRSLATRRGSTANGASSRARRGHARPPRGLLTPACIRCLAGVGVPRSHTRVVVANEREERERFVPSHAILREERRSASARAVPSTQIQASVSGESGLHCASVRQESLRSAPLLRAPPPALG
jgi:hypothetical protein